VLVDRPHGSRRAHESLLAPVMTTYRPPTSSWRETSAHSSKQVHDMVVSLFHMARRDPVSKP